MTRTLLALGLAIVAADCGGTVVRTASVTGTVSGRPVLADNAIFRVVTTTTGETITSWTVDVTTYVQACGCVGGANEQNVTLVLGTVGTTLATGTYSFGADAGANPQGASAGAHYYAVDLSLTNPATLVDASSGAISISEIGASAMVGTFDLTFPSGDHLTGTFDASVCSVITPSPDAGACK